MEAEVDKIRASAKCGKTVWG